MKMIALKVSSLVLLLLLQIAAAASVLADDPAVVASPPPEALSAALTAEARRMIADYPDTRYSHKTYIDKREGICEVDCSGFIVVLLKHRLPKHLESIETNHKRPLAEDFYAAFTPKQGMPVRGWKRIDRLANAKPGDVLAWVKLDRVPGDNTGHVMLIAESPVQEAPDRFRVRIFDSTLHGHAHDQRTRTDQSGIGQGTLWIDVDGQGRPSGYRWKSRTGMLHVAPIAVGRVVPLD